MNTYRIITVVILVILALGIMTSVAVAGTPPPVPTPKVVTPVPPPSGGGSSPSYTAPPAFEPYTEDIKSSDGSVIGKITGIDYSTVRLTASRNAIIEGASYTIDLGADLSSKPRDATIDINIDRNGNVPGGMDNVVILSAASINAQCQYGWSYKSGTPTIKFTFPASPLNGASPDTKYYIVRYDGTSYQILPANIITDNNTATISLSVNDLSGTYTAVMSCPPKPVAGPSSSDLPEPEPTPEPLPCPTPAPAPAGIMGFMSSLWISAFGTFAIGEVAGAMILLTLGKFMR